MAFTQIAITQDYSLADGSEPSGTVKFTVSVPMSNGSVVVPHVPAVARLDATGTISTSLAANTDPSTTPAGTTYLVEELINGYARSFTIRVPHDQGSPLTLYNLVV